MRSALELAVWFMAFVSGLICLLLLSLAFTPGSGSHVGGIGLIAFLSGLSMILFGSVGLTLSGPRLRRLWQDVTR